MKYKNPDVKVLIEGVRCIRCGNQWVPNVRHWPKKCPGCGSYFWDKPIVGRWPKKSAEKATG